MAIVMEVMADDGIGRNDDTLIDDGPADTGSLADFDIFHDDGIVDFCMMLYVDVW